MFNENTFMAEFTQWKWSPSKRSFVETWVFQNQCDVAKPQYFAHKLTKKWPKLSNLITMIKLHFYVSTKKVKCLYVSRTKISLCKCSLRYVWSLAFNRYLTDESSIVDDVGSFWISQLQWGSEISDIQKTLKTGLFFGTILAKTFKNRSSFLSDGIGKPYHWGTQQFFTI